MPFKHIERGINERCHNLPIMKNENKNRLQDQNKTQVKKKKKPHVTA